MNKKIDEKQYWSVVNKNKIIQYELNKIKDSQSLNFETFIKNNFLYGIISKINKFDRYGWIGDNIYFNEQNINYDFNKLNNGDLVEFINIEPVDPKKRKGQAIIVNKINKINQIKEESNIPTVKIKLKVDTKKPCPFCTSVVRAKKNKMLGHLGALESNNVKFPCESLYRHYNNVYKDLDDSDKNHIIKMVNDLYD